MACVKNQDQGRGIDVSVRPGSQGVIVKLSATLAFLEFVARVAGAVTIPLVDFCACVHLAKKGIAANKRS